MSLPPEEQARAELYGIIARLFYAPPDAQLLSELRCRPQIAPAEPGSPESALAAAWRNLVDTCASAIPALLEHEHTELFIGTGKAEITPYLAHYTMRHESDTPLVELRGELARWGIARREGVGEYEDHIAGLCETMRFAIAVQHRPLEEQRDFFGRFLYEGAMRFLAAIDACEKARFYKRVADLARAFLDVEQQAFAMVG
jgi:TorA maturation chaperone TorD